jgi:hypothetical protein
MMSVRAAGACLRLPSSFSARQLFGYYRKRELHLRQQLELLKGHHLHLNIICVGAESFRDDTYEAIDLGLNLMRDSYASVGIGVGRIEHYQIPVAQSRGQEHIANDDDAADLATRWAVKNDGIDCFVVLSYGNAHAGWSKIGNECDKDHKGMKGCVIDPVQNITGFGHEVGHFLGLVHVDDQNNLMHPSANHMNLNGVQSTRWWLPKPLADQFPDESQQNVMLRHCAIKPGCSLER